MRNDVANYASADLGTRSWSLAANVTGNSATGVSLMDAGTGLAGYGLNSGDDSTVASLMGGVLQQSRTVAIDFTVANPGLLMNGYSPLSDVFAVNGLSPSAGDELFVLQVSYDPSNPLLADLSAGELALGWWNGNGWVNAVEGNSGFITLGTAVLASFADYKAGTAGSNGGKNSGVFSLNDFGVDTVNHTVWAVLDHNSIYGAVPEPVTLVMLLAGSALLVARRRRQA